MFGPRERYARDGPDAFGEVDLVALILATGAAGRSSLEIGAELLSVAGGPAGLGRLELAELCAVRGVGLARAVRLHAAVELGRRTVATVPGRSAAIDGAADAAALLAPRLRGLAHEELHALYVDRRHRPLALRQLTRGSDAFTVVDPRQVFRPAIGMGAAGVVLAHNHPSGDPSPSERDVQVTSRVARAGSVLGVALLDHLVIGAGAWRSMAMDGLLVGGPPESAEWLSAP